jgi:hypothetical protein
MLRFSDCSEGNDEKTSLYKNVNQKNLHRVCASASMGFSRRGGGGQFFSIKMKNSKEKNQNTCIKVRVIGLPSSSGNQCLWGLSKPTALSKLRFG